MSQCKLQRLGLVPLSSCPVVSGKDNGLNFEGLMSNLCIKDNGVVAPLQQHSNEVFVIETHPRDPRVFVSAGHDGIIVIWDMFKGDKLNQFKLNVSFLI